MVISYGKDVVHKKEKKKRLHKLLNKYFDGRLRSLTLDGFDSRLDDIDFEAIYDTNVLKIALYYFTGTKWKKRLLSS